MWSIIATRAQTKEAFESRSGKYFALLSTSFAVARSSTPSGTVDGDSRLYRFTDRIPASFDMIKTGQIAAIGTISRVQLS